MTQNDCVSLNKVFSLAGHKYCCCCCCCYCCHCCCCCCCCLCCCCICDGACCVCTAASIRAAADDSRSAAAVIACIATVSSDGAANYQLQSTQQYLRRVITAYLPTLEQQWIVLPTLSDANIWRMLVNDNSLVAWYRIKELCAASPLSALVLQREQMPAW
jgi:hypothetical protein